jgi:hypothetical protein
VISKREDFWLQPSSTSGESIAGFPPQLPVFNPKSGRAGFVVNKVALEHIFP